jgi:GH24 family phage-related lysozyme (muramidase)
MSQVIEFEGQEYDFPDDATNDEILGMLSTVEQPTPAKIPDKPLINTQGDVSQLHVENKAIRKDEGAVRNKDGQHMSYNDSKGFATGGIGHLLTKEEKKTYPIGTEIPDEIANAWFAEDMDEAVGGVDRMLEARRVDLPDAAYDILVNMTFNMGRGGVEAFTKMWDALEVGDYETAAAEMEDSDWFDEVGNRAVRLINRMLAIPSARPKEEEEEEEEEEPEDKI